MGFDPAAVHREGRRLDPKLSLGEIEVAKFRHGHRITELVSFPGGIAALGDGRQLIARLDPSLIGRQRPHPPEGEAAGTAFPRPVLD